MNRNTKTNRLKYWHIGIIFYMLILFAGIGTIANILSTKAAPSSYFVAAESTPTPTPKPTPTPPPTPTPKPTPTPPPTPTPTPAPTDTPPTPTPAPRDTPPTPTPTNNAITTPTVTATSTTVITLPSKTENDHSGPNAPYTPPVPPSSGSKAGGPNILGLSIGISTSVMLIFGGGLFWLYLRRNQQGVTALPQWNRQVATALHKWKKPNLIANTLWTSSRNRATSNSFQQGPVSFTATIPYPASSPHKTGPLPASNEHSVPEANMPQPLISLSPTDPAGPAYRPGDLRPMTMALPKQITSQRASDHIPYPATSNMNPLPLDTFDLAYESTEATKPEHTADEAVPPTISEDQLPTRERNSSTATPLENTPMSTTAEARSVQPPDVADDPMLENVMRQAQLGLFVTPGHEKG